MVTTKDTKVRDLVFTFIIFTIRPYIYKLISHANHYMLMQTMQADGVHHDVSSKQLKSYKC